MNETEPKEPRLEELLVYYTISGDILTFADNENGKDPRPTLANYEIAEEWLVSESPNPTV